MAVTSINRIRIGEIIRINSNLTDKDGNGLPFATLTSVGVDVFDEFGNTLPTIVPTVGDNVNSMHYEVPTATFLEGKIKGRTTIVYPNSRFDSGSATDILVQELFTLFP